MEGGEDFIHLIKENITATIAIGMSGDDFLQKIHDVYFNHFCEGAIKISQEIEQIFPDFTTEQRLDIAKYIHDKFEDLLTLNLEFYNKYLSHGVFRVPAYVHIESEKAIQEPLRNYSKEEDAKLDSQVEEVRKRINEKRIYIKKLKEYLAEAKNLEKALN